MWYYSVYVVRVYMYGHLLLPYSLESSKITERKEIINQLWTDLKDLADARSLALAGAKEIHTFDRDAADTRERIQVRIVKLHF